MREIIVLHLVMFPHIIVVTRGLVGGLELITRVVLIMSVVCFSAHCLFKLSSADFYAGELSLNVRKDDDPRNGAVH